MVLPDGYTESLAYMAGKLNIPIHLDGARIWNAAVFMKQPLSYVTAHADTVTACLSRGLGAPAGTCLMGSAAFIEQARRTTKVLGGYLGQGMDVLAASALQALDE